MGNHNNKKKENMIDVEPNPDIDIPFPQKMHLVITGEQINNRPVLVIGDVHGCLNELKELIHAVEKKYPDCLYIFCGDIINKGPYSLETLRYVRGLGDRAYSVRGNHEDHTLDRWLKWKKSGPDNLPKKKFAWCVGLTMDEAEWLIELPYTISLPSFNVVVVHAGLVPGRPLHCQEPWDMVEMRDIAQGQTSKKRIGTAWGSLWKGPQHVYFGHDAKRSLQQHPYATGLDTGCVFGYQLTAQFLTGDKEMLHVKAKKAYKNKD